MNPKLNNKSKAELLIQSLPYIQKYRDSIVVVKYGGNAMISEILENEVMEDIALLQAIGIRVVLIHGGGPEITCMMSKLGKKAQFKNGLRITDAETIEIAEMVLAGKVNKKLVNIIQKYNGKAVGISGVDGRLCEVKQKSKALGFVGEITSIHPEIILDLLDNGYIPVVATLGYAADGLTYNINGDVAAAEIAVAIHSNRLIMMTDISGVLLDINDPSTLIRKLTINEALKLKKKKIISEGMLPKIDSCIRAIQGGVECVSILDGRKEHSVLLELLTDEGSGTMIYGG
jgi:acetylglutamate kinase